MAVLRTSFGSCDPDHTYTVQTGLGLWKTVGTCTFPACSDFSVVCRGTASLFGITYDFEITVTLTDGDENAQSGPCAVIVRGDTDANASYQVHGDGIAITTTLLGGGTFRFSPDGKSTYVRPSRVPLNAYLKY